MKTTQLQNVQKNLINKIILFLTPVTIIKACSGSVKSISGNMSRFTISPSEGLYSETNSTKVNFKN